MTLIFLNIPGLIGETPSKLILAYPVIELFRTRVTSNGSAGSVKNIVERQNRDGGWQLVSGVKLAMCHYVETKRLSETVLDNITRIYFVLQGVRLLYNILCRIILLCSRHWH